MSNKRFKVKHYNSRIYNPFRDKLIRIILIAVIAVSLFGIGWFAYEPLMDLVNSRNKEIIEENPIEKPTQEQPVFEFREDFLEKETVAVTMPTDVFTNDEKFAEFMEALDENVTAVVIEMKTKTGEVTYSSKQVSVNSAGSISKSAVNLDSRVTAIHNRKLDVIAEIYAFEDVTTPYNSVDMAIRYQSEEGMLWLDDTVDNGGKPWLNPYSDMAQKYILDIIYDAIDVGVDAVILEGVRFPEDNAMDYAYFGIGAEGISNEEILDRFIQRVYSTTVTSDVNLLLGFDTYRLVTGKTLIYGGSPLRYTADGFAPMVDLSDYVGSKIFSDKKYNSVPEDVTELFDRVYSYVDTESAVMPLVSCKGLTKEQVREIASVLKGKGALGYMLIYDREYFTGVKMPPVAEEPEVQQPVYTPPVQQSSSSSAPSNVNEEPAGSSSSSSGESESSSSSEPEEEDHKNRNAYLN